MPFRALRSSLPRLVVSAALCAGAWAAPGSSAAEEAEWAGSESCHTCHRGRFASWHRTFHRTMTQEASPETVQGRFDGRPVTAWGMTVRPVRRGDRFAFEYLAPDSDEVLARYEVDRLVGSHRYQQYLMADPEGGGNFYRLHLLWHNEEQRWVHTNAAFLGPDDQRFDDHVTVWNNNCIFCHNTGPEPRMTNYAELRRRAAAGENVDPRRDAEYASTVSELGIACESCHGPAADHVARHSNWLTRLWYTVTGRDDETIVDPSELDRDASTQVCGQCHGQRLPRDVETMRRFLSDGPLYRAGDDLFESVELVWPESRLPVAPHAGPDFTLRFWNDRTPRLTAYEYQGLLLSECHVEGTLTCGSCHSMHDGDPAGMLTAEMKGDAACTGCHVDIGEDVTAHSHHPEGAASQCTGCHMPEVVYGVMEIHRSHRIEVPDPAADAAAERPNACTLCHADRSLAWAEAETARLWNREPAHVAALPGLESDLPEGIVRLFAGDPVERAVAATAVGRSIERGHLEQPERWRAPLLQALEDDYPAVRRFARRSLAQLAAAAGDPLDWREALAAFDPLHPGADEALADLMEHYSAHFGSTSEAWHGADLAVLRRLGRQRSEAINIGE